jgi:DNA-binding NarL/FixJ family response regulator
MPVYRVLIADDHLVVRAGIRALIESIDGVTVVGEANDGREAVELAASLRPDIVLLDVTMPGLNGLEAATRLQEASPSTRVIILSMHANDAYVRTALKAGAVGYVLKSATATELQTALQTVAQGEIYLSPAVSKQVVKGFVDSTRHTGSPLDLLTTRQREILQLIAEGRTTKEVAFTLSISGKTVETHRAQIMERLEIRDLAGLVRFAIRTGLISPDA